MMIPMAVETLAKECSLLQTRKKLVGSKLISMQWLLQRFEDTQKMATALLPAQNLLHLAQGCPIH
jgi:hypothetical protein